MTAEIAELIISGIYDVKPLIRLLKDHEVNSRSFYEYLAKVPNYPRLYQIAQQARAELLADEIIEIADTDLDPIRARNRIEARKWYASKMQPQKYGDRIDINLTETVDIRGALSEARSRVLADVVVLAVEDLEPIDPWS